MNTIKQTLKEIQAQKWLERIEAFNVFMDAHFGGPLQVGDILEVPTSDVINGGILNSDQFMEMIVYGPIGRIHGSASVAVPLMLRKKNNLEINDPHNNYVLGHTASRLKRAKKIGHEPLVVGKDRVGLCDVVNVP